MASPFFSIVVPVYNGEKYLQDCLDSILEQTFSELEIIVVDDGSNDSSLEICRKVQGKDPRVSLLRQKHLGPFSARKRAYPSISGEYVLHVDADDTLRFDALERLYQIVIAHPYDIVLFDYSSRADFATRDSRLPFTSSREFNEHQKSELLNLLLYRGCLNSMCFKAIKADLIQQVVYPDDMDNMITGEDLLQSAYLLDASRCEYYLRDQLYYYRCNSSGTTYTFRQSDIEDRLCSRKHLDSLFRKWKSVEGFSLSRLDVLRSLLEAFYRYLQSGVFSGEEELLLTRMPALLDDEMIKDAWSERSVRNQLRIDMYIALSLLFHAHYKAAFQCIKIIMILRQKDTN